MTRPRESKTASEIKAGDWCVFGPLTYRAGEPWTENDKVFIQWGNGTISAFHPSERINVEPREDGS